MKKFIATILIFMSSYCLYADTDMNELLDLVTTYNETKVVLDEAARHKALTTVKTEVKNYNETKVVLNDVNRYIDLSIFKLEVTPSFFISANSFMHTHAWYLWKNYEKAKGFNKIKIGEQIKKISTYYK